MGSHVILYFPLQQVENRLPKRSATYASLIPIGFALIQHGAPIPIVLTFMIAASGLSLPEMVILGRVLRPSLVLLFIGATVAIYTLVGFGFVWM